MAANRLLYGENASGAFAGGANDLSGNILSELSRRLSRGQLLHNNGIATLLTTNSTQTSEWAGIPSGPTTPTLPTEPPIKAHPAPQPHLLDNACSDLFATITNTKERRQRAAGQIVLFA